MAVTFSDLHTEQGLKTLEEHLAGKTYISGDQLSFDDVKIYAAVLEKPGDGFPNASKWYDNIASHLAKSFPEKAVGVRVGGGVAPSEAPQSEAPAAADGDDDDIDLSADEAEDEKKAAEERESANTQSSRAPTHHSQSSQSAGMYTTSSLQDESSPTTMNISERLIGVKKAKRHQQRDEQFKKLMEQNEKLINVISEGNAEWNELQRQKLEVQRMKEENKILFADLSSVNDPAYKAFFEEERAKIIRRRKSETQYAEHGEGSGSQY